MARIALAIGGAVAGALIPGAIEGYTLAGVISGASAGLAIGTSVGTLFSRHMPDMPPLQDLQVSGSAPGSPIPFGWGKGRIAGQLIWTSGKVATPIDSGSGGGGNSVTGYKYTASFAFAFGEGPAGFTRIWGDTKLIYSAISSLGSDLPPAAFPPWSNTRTYNPGNQVSYDGQVYIAIAISTGTPPTSDTTGTIWQISTSYPLYIPDGGVTYNPGDTVQYNGQVWVNVKSDTHTPGSDDRWLTLEQYYPLPVIYPGDEAQNPDPTIVAAEGLEYTPANRGLCYVVYEDMPLDTFGNRIPNLRAEINFTRTSGIL
jgi:chitodextrinase